MNGPSRIDVFRDGHGLARRYVQWSLRRGRVLWALALIVGLPSLARTAQLYTRLSSDVEALLPQRAPSVQALQELRERMAGLRYLGILVDTGTAENLAAGERFLDDLAERIRRYPTSLVANVKTGVGDEIRYRERHAALYVDLADLERVREDIEAWRDAGVSRALGANLVDDEDAPTRGERLRTELRALEEKYATRGKAKGSFHGERFSSPEKKLTLLLVQTAKFTTGADLGKALFARVQEDIRELGGPDRYAPGMRIGYTGDIAIGVEELAALQSDLTVSSLVVTVLVMVSVLAFYRWWGALPALVLPLSLAVPCAFALASAPPLGVTALNANTGFLGSVIVGNGVNFGIILLARYLEERRAGAGVEDALVVAVSGTRVGTSVAALAAAAAYGSLTSTRFRGFAQFGWIGALGMLTCWGAAFLLGPSLIACLDRRPYVGRARGDDRRVMGRVAALVSRRAPAIAVGALVVTALAGLKIRHFGPEAIEYDFSHLRRADSRVSGSAYWGARMDDLLGHYLTPLVFLCDDRAGASRLSFALKQASREPPLSAQIDSIVSVDDLLPSDQERKLAVLAALRADLTPRVRGRLGDGERSAVERFFDNAPLVPVRGDDLPPAMTAGLRERDGTLDRAVLVYPRPSPATWHGSTIKSLTSSLRTIASRAAFGGRPARLAGSLPLSADIVTSIESDAPRLTLLALVAVAALVGAIFRVTSATPFIVGSLVVAVAWLLGALMTLGIKINFCNFIAFPITFGIGVDYAVNIMARCREGRSQHVLEAVRSTGGAVGLCSLTTVIGYSSLLFAQNRALFLFGVAAVLGELSCLVTAVVVLPAAITLLQRQAARVTIDPPPRTVEGAREARDTVSGPAT